MSILERIKATKAPEGKKVFGVITGQRLAGKTSVAGTLPGKTLLLQTAILESGSKSAELLAKKLGNELYVVSFKTVPELLDLLNELTTDEDFDNVVVDGLSGLTELKYDEPRVQVLRKGKGNSIFEAFREIGDSANQVMLALKGLTYPEKTKKPKNTWITCALAVKHDKDGEIIEVTLETKGQMAVTAVTKLAEAVVTVLHPIKTDKGTSGHRLITKTTGFWPGRIDGLLAEDNPGVIEPANLNEVLKLIS